MQKGLLAEWIELERVAMSQASSLSGNAWLWTELKETLEKEDRMRRTAGWDGPRKSEKDDGDDVALDSILDAEPEEEWEIGSDGYESDGLES